MKPARTTKQSETLGRVLGLVGVLIFSGTLPATRLAIDTFDPWFLTFARAMLATVAAALTLLMLRKSFPKGQAVQLFIIGLLLVFGFPGFVALAMQSVPSSHGGVILGILPLATAIFAALLGGERPSLLFWICGVAGAFLIAVFALRDGGWGFAVGDIWLLIAGICAAAGYVMSGKLSRSMIGWEVISWALLLTAPISLIGTLSLWEAPYISAPSRDLFALLYLSLGSMYLGFFAWNSGLALGGIARVGQLQLLQTFFTLAIAALLLGEEITMETLAFAAAIMLIVLVGIKARVTQKPAASRGL